MQAGSKSSLVRTVHQYEVYCIFFFVEVQAICVWGIFWKALLTKHEVYYNLTRRLGKWRQGIENTYIYRKKPGVLPTFFKSYSHSCSSGVHYWEGRPHIHGVLCLTCDMPGTTCFTINYWDIIQYQYLGNCQPTPPLTQQQSIDNKSRLMLG